MFSVSDTGTNDDLIIRFQVEIGVDGIDFDLIPLFTYSFLYMFSNLFGVIVCCGIEQQCLFDVISFLVNSS